VSGYNFLPNKNKIIPDTLFKMGSITKTFTATIILKLAEENKLTLNDSLIKWLPQYSRWKNIKIKNLLNHTSGIYNYTHGADWDNKLRNNPKKHWLSIELANIAYQHDNLFNPGSKYSYSNTDYVLLGLIIEKVTNKSIQQVFNEYFHTYHLKNTFYTTSGYSATAMKRLAHGYNRDGTFESNKDITFVSYGGQADGAIISTPNDIIYWLNQLFSGKIISNKSLKDMMTIISERDAKSINIKNIHLQNNILKMPVSDVGEGYGMGLVYFKSYGLAWTHAGGILGYESLYTFNPCNGIYLALAYNVKPKQQLIFAKIANDIFSILLASPFIANNIENYQKNNIIPNFCYSVKDETLQDRKKS